MHIVPKILISTLILLVNLNLYADEQRNETMQASGQAVNAVWQEHQEKFHLNSFYTYYSCDGVESKVETLLTELGARDVKARATGCFELDAQLGRSLRVSVEFKTLSTDVSLEGESVNASLQNVHIKPRHPRGVGLGDCELIEKIQDKLLGSFEHEVIKENRKCFSGQQSLGDVNWKLKVLKATS